MEELPLEEFYKRSKEPDGRHYYCKGCCKKHRAAERVKKRDKKSRITYRQQYRAVQELGHAQEDVDEIALSELYNRDGGQCQICGKRVPSNEASIDHIVPLSRGGTHTWDNVQLTHQRCNLKKSNKI